MRILQVTNLISHHQLPLARQLARIVGDENFRFCATHAPDTERKKLGWNSQDSDPWILRAGDFEIDRLEFEKWWDEADVVLCGERRFERMADRLSENKLTFYMSERWWKPPISKYRLLHPKFFQMALLFRRISHSSAFHYLPIGPYAAEDIASITNIKSRMWRWGYFTELPNTTHQVDYHQNRPLKILWIGRMLDWKRVDTLIKASTVLSRNHISFILTIIGDGPERARLKAMASELLDEKCYAFHDPIPASQVSQIMADHDVYVLPSSAYEGWGAVINEAMSCGCAVVASNGAGAAAAMIEDGVNGFLFKPGDWRGLADLLAQLSDSPELRQSISNMGKHTVEQTWSPRIVAERFCSVIEALHSNRDVPFYSTGPMSRASRRNNEKNTDKRI